MIPEDFEVGRSRAVAPLFYRAPSPPSKLYIPGEYQHAGVEYCLNRNNAIIGDAPGVGKTCQAILLSNALGAEANLAIVPASLLLNWEREIWLWSTIPNVHTYAIKKSSDGVNLTAHWVIVSYDMLRHPSIFAALMSRMWDHLVLDEAHYIKDPKGNKRTKAICGWVDKGTYVPGLCDVAGRMTLLTGTLLPNQPIESYNAIRLLNHAAIDNASLETFRNFYYEEGEGMVRGPVASRDKKTGQIVFENKVHWSNKVRNQPRNLDDLQHRLRKHLMVRRLKEDVLHELPPKRWHPFPLGTTPELRAAMKHPGWTEAEKLYEMDPDAFDNDMPVDGAVSTARRLLGEAKAPAVADYIEDLFHGGITKVVVGAWHHSVLDYLRERLKHLGLVYMDGGTSPTGKQRAVDRFQKEEEVGCMLGQMLPLGEGHTLTAAQDGVLAEPFWVPGKNDQFLDRLHRRGQLGMVTGHIPVVPGTLDEKILSKAIEKDYHIYATLDRRGKS